MFLVTILLPPGEQFLDTGSKRQFQKIGKKSWRTGSGVFYNSLESVASVLTTYASNQPPFWNAILEVTAVSSASPLPIQILGPGHERPGPQLAHSQERWKWWADRVLCHSKQVKPIFSQTMARLYVHWSAGLEVLWLPPRTALGCLAAWREGSTRWRTCWHPGEAYFDLFFTPFQNFLEITRLIFWNCS